MLTDEQRQQIESLYRRFGKGVGSYVLTRTGDRHLAESITGRVFLIVVRRFEQCTGNPVAWLWSIVRSELARQFRDRKRHEPIAGHSAAACGHEPADTLTDPADRVEQADQAVQIRWALDQLDEPAHTLVYMKFFLEMSNTDIAAALAMTPGHVGVSAHRALKRLKELMERGRANAGGSTGRQVPRPQSDQSVEVSSGRSLATA